MKKVIGILAVAIVAMSVSFAQAQDNGTAKAKPAKKAKTEKTAVKADKSDKTAAKTEKKDATMKKGGAKKAAPKKAKAPAAPAN
jgi:hypothetical protein